MAQFTYGKRMLMAALQKTARHEVSKHRSMDQIENEHTQLDHSTKVADWLKECPSTSSLSIDAGSLGVPPSVKSSTLENFPALRIDKKQDNEIMANDYWQDLESSEENYQPSEVTTDSDQESVHAQEDHDFVDKGIYVGFARSRKETSGYFLDKRQICFFCNKGQLNLARHVAQIHKVEREVALMLSYKETGNNENYLKELTRIRCAGNFKHNLNVLKEGRTDIIVVKRPSKKRSIFKFLPCPHCLGFYYKAELWRHAKKCLLKTENSDQSCAVLRQSRLLLESASLPAKVGNELSENMKCLMAAMKDDELTRSAAKDELLIHYGETLLKKYGPAKKNDIAQRMRQLIRLLVSCRELRKTRLTFKEILCGQNFDLCLEATSNLCGLTITADGKREFKIPSLALRLGHLLKKMAIVKKGRCLREDNMDALKEAEMFERLLRDEWTDAVSSNALNTLKRRKDQTVESLPVTEDLLQLKNHQSKIIEKTLRELKSFPNYTSWRTLAQTVMARLIIFNKRRAGEVARLLHETYQNRPTWKTAGHSEIIESLQPLERKLLDKTDLVMVPGKRSRKVPILIPENITESMRLLSNTRENVGIPVSNPYFFSSKSKNGNLDGWQAIKASTLEAHLKNPDFITSTKCRKYNATITQLFDLPPGDIEWLANHMGHSVNIHKQYYRLHESTIEITKVGKLLTAVDSGKGLKQKGNSEGDTGSEYTPDKSLDKVSGAETNDEEGGECTFVHQSEEESSDSFQFVHGKRQRKRVRSEKGHDSSPEHEQLNKASENDTELGNVPKKRKVTSRRKWTFSEVNCLKEAFKDLLKQKIYPSAHQIQTAKTRFPVLAERSIVQIKAKLQHLMK